MFATGPYPHVYSYILLPLFHIPAKYYDLVNSYEMEVDIFVFVTGSYLIDVYAAATTTTPAPTHPPPPPHQHRRHHHSTNSPHTTPHLRPRPLFCFPSSLVILLLSGSGLRVSSSSP